MCLQHLAQQSNCGCGIYAFHEPNKLLTDYDYMFGSAETTPVFISRVTPYGIYWKHTWGWRASDVEMDRGYIVYDKENHGEEWGHGLAALVKSVIGDLDIRMLDIGEVRRNIMGALASVDDPLPTHEPPEPELINPFPVAPARLE